MKEIAAAVYTYGNSVPVIRNTTSGMISESDHKGCTDPFGQEEKAQAWKWKSLNKYCAADKYYPDILRKEGNLLRTAAPMTLF